MSDDFIKGMDALMEELKGLPGNIERNSLRKALEEMAVMFAAAASQEAPVSDAPRTVKHRNSWVTYLPGYLKSSIEARSARVRKGVVQTGVTGAFYAKFIEKGHTLKNGETTVGHVPANPFIRRAFEANKEWALDVGKRVLLEEIKKRIDRLRRKMAKANGG